MIFSIIKKGQVINKFTQLINSEWCPCIIFELNVGMSPIEGYSYDFALPGASLLWGQTLRDTQHTQNVSGNQT